MIMGYLEEHPLVGSSLFKMANYNKLNTALKIFYDNSKKMLLPHYNQ